MITHQVVAKNCDRQALNLNFLFIFFFFFIFSYLHLTFQYFIVHSYINKMGDAGFFKVI